MNVLSKILLLGVSFVQFVNIQAQDTKGSEYRYVGPLEIINDDSEPYYYVDNSLLKIEKVDYSDVFETLLTPIEGRQYDDLTQLFIEDKLRLACDFFMPSREYNGELYYSPVNGILGNDFRRIEIYLYPEFIKKDSVTYIVKGRSKVKRNICDFTGEIKIKKIYKLADEDYIPNSSYRIIAEYTFWEDLSQKFSGKFSGIFGAYGYINDNFPEVIQVDNLNDVADGYFNQTYVGTWQSYIEPQKIKRCVWGDGRLPFSFDFDIGVGDICINPKYITPEWKSYIYLEEYNIIEVSNTEFRLEHKNPWW